MTVTTFYLKNVKPQEKRFEVADRDGLSVRIFPSGTKTFQYAFRHDGERFRLKYGNFPEMSLKEARELHAEAKKLKDQGINPLKHNREEERVRKDADTVDELIEEWMERYCKVHRKRPEIPERSLKADVSPIIGKYKVADVSRRDVIKLLDKILDRGSKAQANKTLALLKQLFQYAVERGIIEVSPIASVRKKSVGGVSKPRERCLEDEEIIIMWNRLEETPLSEYVIVATKILLVTGQRRGEITQAAWKDVDFKKRIWRIPEENSKNGKAHQVPLSLLAILLFERLKAIQVNEWVMPSPNHQTHMSEKAITRAINRYQEFIGIEKWTPHDLRRTCATKLAELQTAPHVVEKILNHTLEGVMAVYNRFDYMPERREALDKWSDKLEDFISISATVKALRAAD